VVVVVFGIVTVNAVCSFSFSDSLLLFYVLLLLFVLNTARMWWIVSSDELHRLSYHVTENVLNVYISHWNILAIITVKHFICSPHSKSTFWHLN